MHKNTLKQY